MDEFKGTITKVAKSIKKSSGSLIKTTRLSMQISNEELNLKSLYEEIGRKVHEIYMYGGSLGKFFDDKYRELQAQEYLIGTLRAELESAKGCVICPACKASVPKESGFCPKCGEVIAGGSDKAAIPAKGIRSDADMWDAVPRAFEEPTVTKPDETYAPAHRAPVRPPETQNAPPPVQKKCPVCGGLNDMPERFCLSCGRML